MYKVRLYKGGKCNTRETFCAVQAACMLLVLRERQKVQCTIEVGTETPGQNYSRVGALRCSVGSRRRWDAQLATDLFPRRAKPFAGRPRGMATQFPGVSSDAPAPPSSCASRRQRPGAGMLALCQLVLFCFLIIISPLESPRIHGARDPRQSIPNPPSPSTRSNAFDDA